MREYRAGLLIADGPSLGERKSSEGAGVGYQQVADGRRALVGIERCLRLSTYGGMERAGKLGSEGQAPLRADDPVVGTNQADPEQGSGLGRGFALGDDTPVSVLEMPAVRCVAPGD